MPGRIRLAASTFLFAVVAIAAAALPAAAADVAVFFSPHGGCRTAIIRQIDTATRSIDAALYQLTDQPLARSLAAAAGRGVRVRVILTPQAEGAAPLPAAFIAKSGGLIATDAEEKLFHNKYAVIDGATTISGSYNWTANAETRNAENLIIIADGRTAAAFASNFNGHWSHSRPFVPNGPAPKRQNTPRRVSLSPQNPAQEERSLSWLASLVP